ncbi:MAG: DoxX family membrane protein [Gemmatimonadales bacterium]
MTTAVQPDQRKLALALTILRISLGVFLLIWSLEKFFLPQSTIGIWKGFYLIKIGESMPYIIGAVETLVSVAIILGFMRTWSYGIGLAINTVSVLSTWKQLIDPWGLIFDTRNNHLFLAGVPMLAGFVVLFMLRDWDIWTLDGRKKAP